MLHGLQRGIASALAFVSLSFAIESTASAEALFDFDLYGHFASHLAVYDGDIEIQNNSSRFGLEPGLTLGKIRVFGRAEFGVNLVQSNMHFNADSNPSGGGMLQLGQVSNQEAITTRLGFVGLDFDRYGTLTFGKQWSVFYDIAVWTDLFWVFGGQGNPTYNAGTDGGLSGTGRAEMALNYRVSIRDLSLGAQLQFRGGDDQLVSSASGALSYEFPFGLSIGAAYNHTFYTDRIDPSLIYGWNGKDAQVVIGGARFQFRGLTLAVTGSRSWNQELVQVEEDSIIYDTWGIETLIRYVWNDRVGLEFGYNQAQPLSTVDLLSPDFALMYFIIGGSFRFYDNVLIYAEGKVDIGRDATGASKISVFTVGIRIGFSTADIFGNLFQPRSNELDQSAQTSADERSNDSENVSESRGEEDTTVAQDRTLSE